jgi:uncharacterized coiled-coil protein SlyX
MARPSFRDRFFTPRVAEAIMSPLGILLAGVGAAAGILVGLPVVAAAGIGVAAWGGRVIAAVPRQAPSARVAPSSLSEPWRSYGVQAEEAKRRFDNVVDSVAPGPLRERLELLSGRLDQGVDESWRIARRGHQIGAAIDKIDTVSAQAELADLRYRLGEAAPSPAQEQTIEALEAQLASAQRLTALAERSRDRLRLLDARFDELLARTVEVSVSGGDADVLGEDVDGLVRELETLRIAMEEADRAGTPQLEPPA